MHFFWSHSKENKKKPFVQPFSVTNSYNWLVVVVNTAWEAQLLVIKTVLWQELPGDQAVNHLLSLLPSLPPFSSVPPGFAELTGGSASGQWQPQARTTILRYFLRMTLELSSK